MELSAVQSSIAKREFGKYFRKATEGHPVLISNHLTNKKAILVDYEFFEDMLEVQEELKDDKLNKQIKESYANYKKGEFKKGVEGLIDIMNESTKRKLMGKKHA